MQSRKSHWPSSPGADGLRSSFGTLRCLNAQRISQSLREDVPEKRTVDPAEATKETAKRSCNHEPCLETAVGVLAGMPGRRFGGRLFDILCCRHSVAGCNWNMPLKTSWPEVSVSIYTCLVSLGARIRNSVCRSPSHKLMYPVGILDMPSCQIDRKILRTPWYRYM